MAQLARNCSVWQLTGAALHFDNKSDARVSVSIKEVPLGTQITFASKRVRNVNLERSLRTFVEEKCSESRYLDWFESCDFFLLSKRIFYVKNNHVPFDEISPFEVRNLPEVYTCHPVQGHKPWNDYVNILWAKIRWRQMFNWKILPTTVTDTYGRGAALRERGFK